MSKILLGLVLGSIAGVIDVIPMFMQKLSWSANISAFCLWVVAGFMIATSSLEMNSILKGLLIAFLILLPNLVLIASKDTSAWLSN